MNDLSKTPGTDFSLCSKDALSRCSTAGTSRSIRNLIKKPNLIKGSKNVVIERVF